MKPTALIATTTSWFPTARLAVGLADAGFHVEAVCPPRHPLSTLDSMQRVHAYRSLRPLSSFASAILLAKPDFIVPGDDLAANYLHRLHTAECARHDSRSIVCAAIERSLGAPESFPVVFARSSFMQVALAENIRAPRTAVLSGRESLLAFASTSGFPFVLKADGTSGGDGVRIVNSLPEAEDAYRSLAAPPMLARALKRTLFDRDSALFWPAVSRRPAVVNAQEFAPGREATSAIACWKGIVLAELQFEVIEKAQSRGHATVVRSIRNSEISCAAEKLAERLGLSGLHGLDFMLESETGKAHLIEINPRSTQVGHLALGDRQDLPAALYAAVSGAEPKPLPAVTENKTIALFPQEWVRDANSPWLESAFHDIPWRQPELVRACVLSRRKQSIWYRANKQAPLRTAVHTSDTGVGTADLPQLTLEGGASPLVSTRLDTFASRLATQSETIRCVDTEASLQ